MIAESEIPDNYKSCEPAEDGNGFVCENEIDSEKPGEDALCGDMVRGGWEGYAPFYCRTGESGKSGQWKTIMEEEDENRNGISGEATSEARCDGEVVRLNYCIKGARDGKTNKAIGTKKLTIYEYNDLVTLSTLWALAPRDDFDPTRRILQSGYLPYGFNIQNVNFARTGNVGIGVLDKTATEKLEVIGSGMKFWGGKFCQKLDGSFTTKSCNKDKDCKDDENPNDVCVYTDEAVAGYGFGSFRKINSRADFKVLGEVSIWDWEIDGDGEQTGWEVPITQIGENISTLGKVAIGTGFIFADFCEAEDGVYSFSTETEECDRTDSEDHDANLETPNVLSACDSNPEQCQKRGPFFCENTFFACDPTEDFSGICGADLNDVPVNCVARNIDELPDLILPESSSIAAGEMRSSRFCDATGKNCFVFSPEEIIAFNSQNGFYSNFSAGAGNFFGPVKIGGSYALAMPFGLNLSDADLGFEIVGSADGVFVLKKFTDNGTPSAQLWNLNGAVGAPFAFENPAKDSLHFFNGELFYLFCDGSNLCEIAKLDLSTGEFKTDPLEVNFLSDANEIFLTDDGAELIVGFRENGTDLRFVKLGGTEVLRVDLQFASGDVLNSVAISGSDFFFTFKDFDAAEEKICTANATDVATCFSLLDSTATESKILSANAERILIAVTKFDTDKYLVETREVKIVDTDIVEKIIATNEFGVSAGENFAVAPIAGKNFFLVATEKIADSESVSIFDFVNLNLPTENLLQIGGGASATQFSSDRFCDAAGEKCFEYKEENETVVETVTVNTCKYFVNTSVPVTATCRSFSPGDTDVFDTGTFLQKFERCDDFSYGTTTTIDDDDFKAGLNYCGGNANFEIETSSS
jgi:hypothetical protein